MSSCILHLLCPELHFHTTELLLLCSVSSLGTLETFVSSANKVEPKKRERERDEVSEPSFPGGHFPASHGRERQSSFNANGWPVAPFSLDTMCLFA